MFGKGNAAEEEEEEGSSSVVFVLTFAFFWGGERQSLSSGIEEAQISLDLIFCVAVGERVCTRIRITRRETRFGARPTTNTRPSEQGDARSRRGRDGEKSIVEMDSPAIQRCLKDIKKRRKDLRLVPPADVHIDYEDPTSLLGEGGFCSAYRATYNDETVCARVIDEDREPNKEQTAVGEVATISNLPAIAVKIYGYTWTQKPGPMFDKRKHLAVICELCPHGNLEDFMKKEKEPLAPGVKLDCFLQVLDGLEQLKAKRVIWRDLKAKNILVRDVKRHAKTNKVTKVQIAFTDWGTAVELPKMGKRRMTLQGPGTDGYIAPETRGNGYDYQVDMWAFLLWAASMCLTVECLVDCRLEEKLAGLQLEKKSHATSAQEKKVLSILDAFDFEVERGCAPIYNFLKRETQWVEPGQRWSCDEAIECLVAFRDENVNLQLPTEYACTPAKRDNSFYEESSDDEEEEEEEKGEDGNENEAVGTAIKGTLVKPTIAQQRFNAHNIAMNFNSIQRTPYNPMSEKYTPIASRKKSATFQLDHENNVYSTAKKPTSSSSRKTNQPLRSILKTGGSNTSRSANGSANNYSYASPVRFDDKPSPMVVYSATPGFNRRPMHSRRNGDVVLPPPLFAEAEREAEMYKEKMLRNGDKEEEDSEEEEEEIETTQPLDVGDKENSIDEANSGVRPRSFAMPPRKLVGRNNALQSSNETNKNNNIRNARSSKRDVKPPKIFSPPLIEKAGKKRKAAATSSAVAAAAPKRRGRAAATAATGGGDNSMALVLKTAGCSKCRWSPRGCGRCDPDTPRIPRGISAARKKAKEAAKRPRGRPPGSKNKDNKKLAVVKTKATKKVVQKKRKAPTAKKKTVETKDTSTGCSKCRYSKNGCGACDPSKPRQRRGPRKSTEPQVLCLPAPGEDGGRRVVKTFERRKNPVGRPTKHTRPIRTELGCSKCRYTACSKCRNELAFDRALFGTPAAPKTKSRLL